MIKDTQTDKTLIEIPKDLLNTDWNRISGHAAIKIITSRFSWIDEETFRIVNEANLDCIFKIKKIETQVASIVFEQEPQYELELVSCVKVDNLTLNVNTRDVPHVTKH